MEDHCLNDSEGILNFVTLCALGTASKTIKAILQKLAARVVLLYTSKDDANESLACAKYSFFVLIGKLYA
jgi:hypothetical protein